MRELVRSAIGFAVCLVILAGAVYWQGHHHPHHVAHTMNDAIDVQLTI